MSVINPKGPQDRQKPRLTVQEMLNNALKLQGANMMQKAQLDMMATKVIIILRKMKDYKSEHGFNDEIYVDGQGEYLGAEAARKLLQDIEETLSMTREDASKARAGFEYPDVKIQAVINRATEEIAQILLDDGKA